MKALRIVVRPEGSSLALGGHSPPRQGGDKATARDSDGRPTLPASALRGALRLELERLLRGRGGEDACSANRPETGEPCTCRVCRLFGQSGTAAGSLRLSDAVLVSAGDAGDAVALRPRVAVGRRRRAAVEKLLGFLETTPPLGRTRPAEFHADAWLVDAEQADEDLRSLHAACAALRGLGGSRARGLGWVRCELVELDETAASSSQAGSRSEPSPGGGLRLSLEALEPLHLGLGPPVGYFQPSRRYALGSTVRGAVAFALLENRLCQGEDPVFQRLIDEASFGSARLADDRPSVTRRRCRPAGHVFDDLAVELLRRRAAEDGLALAVNPEGTCVEPGCGAVKAVPETYPEGVVAPRVRVRTRTALNRRTGTSMDAKLFSHEVLEPFQDDGGNRHPLVLTAEVRGLGEETAALLASLDGRRVWLGGKRGQGMGACRVRIEAVRSQSAEEARRKVDDLRRVLEEGWAALAEAAGRDLKTFFGDGELPLAVVLQEAWLPADGASPRALRSGPLAATAGEPFAAFVHLEEAGRFGALEARRYGAPDSVERGEVTPRPVVSAGSVYVYKVTRTTLDDSLESWLELGREGCGERRRQGWGRFTVRGPERDY